MCKNIHIYVYIHVNLCVYVYPTKTDFADNPTYFRSTIIEMESHIYEH